MTTEFLADFGTVYGTPRHDSDNDDDKNDNDTYIYNANDDDDDDDGSGNGNVNSNNSYYNYNNNSKNERKHIHDSSSSFIVPTIFTEQHARFTTSFNRFFLGKNIKIHVAKRNIHGKKSYWKN